MKHLPPSLRAAGLAGLLCVAQGVLAEGVFAQPPALQTESPRSELRFVERWQPRDTALDLTPERLPVPDARKPNTDALPTPPPELPASDGTETLRESGGPPNVKNPMVPATALALSDVESMALGSNPTLAQASARVRAAQGAYQQAGRPKNPEIGYVGNEIGNNNTAGFQGGFVSQEFILGGKLQLDQGVAGQQVAQARQRFEAQRWRVLNDVRIAFYQVLIAQRTVEVSQELARIGQQGVSAAQSLLDAKEVSRVDLLQARIETNTAYVGLENARNRHQAAWRRLAAVAGVPHLKLTPLVGELKMSECLLDWDASLHRLWSSSPELGEARAGVQRALLAAQRARREVIPNVDVMAGGQHDNTTGFDTGNLQISVPIAIWNRNRGGIAQADALVTAARAEVSRVELDLQARLAEAFEQYSNARVQVDRYNTQILPDARASLDLVTTGYRNGEFSFLVLLTAQRTYFRTNVDYYAALRTLWENTVAIEGLLLTGSLEAR